jgi:hypothetical protein
LPQLLPTAAKDTQTAPNTGHSDPDVEEDEETESFSALQGEALAISTPYAIFLQFI